jgi:hypothetical protein
LIKIGTDGRDIVGGAGITGFGIFRREITGIVLSGMLDRLSGHADLSS